MEEDIEHKIDILNIVEQKDFNKETCEDSYIEAVLLGIKTTLNELERLQKEFEAVDHECSRLEQKEIELEKENEHYKELMYALETYYNITEEDLEKCVKEDR